MNETHQDPLVAERQSAQSERLIDYLYDELSPDERAAFEDELAQSPTLAAELAALRGARSSFAALPAEPMPRGLLDHVLRQADAQAASFAKATTAQAGGESFFSRALEGLRRLVFQPAFAMGLVLFMVAGVALVATRNPNEIAGMDLPRDAQRIPPVAMAPAEVAAAPAPVAQASAAEAASKESEGVLAEFAAAEPLGAAQAEPTPSDEGRGRLEKAAEAKEDQPARFVEAKVKGDFDDYKAGAPAQPRPTRPSTASGPIKDSVVANREGGTWADSGLADSARGGAAEGDAELAVGTGASGSKTTATPTVAEASTAGSRNAPKAEAAPVPDTAREEERADKKVARAAPVETAESPTREAAPPRKSSNDDEFSKVPSAPTPPTAKPAEPAPTGERIYTTLKQQLAAGALADAEKSLSELARLEGETTRVKQARDALNRAKAASQARPVDTKPLPEPASTPR